MTTLAIKEREALEALEEVIERGLDSFIEVGNALLQVRKEKLYRGEYDTFEIYCDLRWGMNRGRAYQMIQAAEVAGNLSTKVYIQPVSERQVRPLVKLEPPEQIKAWNEASETAKTPGKPTAKEVTVAVRRIRPVLPPRIQPNGQTPDSAQLQKLKFDWNESNDADHAAFRVWIGEEE